MTTTAKVTMRRIATVAAATLTAVVAWTVASDVVGVDVAIDRGSGRSEIGLGAVVATSLVVGLAAWALLAVLERTLRRRAGRVWTVVAVAVLAVSLLGPLGASNMASVVSLAVLHLVVGTVLLVGLPARASRA